MMKNRGNARKHLLLIWAIAVLVCLSCFYPVVNEILSTSRNWQQNLYTPTMINKIDGEYFIVDCWHHRVIYNDNLNDDIIEWKTLTEDVSGAHSIVGGGGTYVCDDTDNSMLRVFRKEGNQFKQTQTIPNITGRPHYVKYDEVTELFYVISSEEGKVWTFYNDNGNIKADGVYTINEITNSYVRSFNIIDGYMYFVSGPGYIYKVEYIDKTYEVIASYEVPGEMIGMNFIEKIDDYFYLTSYVSSEQVIAPMFVRIKDLNDLKDGKYEDLYSEFGFTGTPYYITKFDDKYFIAEIDQASGIKSFEVHNNKIGNIETHYYFEGHSDASQSRRESRY